MRTKPSASLQNEGYSLTPQLTVSGPKAAVVGLLVQPGKAAALIASGALESAGDTRVLDIFAGVMDEFDPAFNLVTP